jgi:hypothetical protein
VTATSLPVRFRRARAGLAVGLALSLSATMVLAAELQFSASVDQTTVGLGEQFQLVLTVQGEDMLSVPSPTLPPLPDLNVLGSTSSQSTNISIINGQIKKQATVNFIYALSAKKLGKTTIPACKLTYQGHEYASQPIDITVVGAARGQAAPMPAAPGLPPARAQVPIEGNLYLSVVPSRRTVYVGEPFTVEVSLCTRFQIANGGWAAVPSFDGFWAENVFDADKFDFQKRIIDGKQYGVSLLKKQILVPLGPGPATIKPLAFNVVVAQPPRDFFDVFGSTQSARIESKPLVINVLPLPETGKPRQFTGGVGQFTLAGSLDRTSTTNSEPVNLTLRISGSGNLRMIDKPEIAPVTGLKILPPESSDESHATRDALGGSKTFRFPIIPQGDGKFVIAPVAFAYFDPKAKSYRTLETGPFEFSASGSATSSRLVEATGLKVLGTDINYIKPDATALAIARAGPQPWPSLLYLLSVAMVGGSFWYRGHRDRLQSDRGYARKTRSSALVRRRLRDAEQLLKKRDERGFYGALTRAVTGYIGDRFDIDTHAMTRDQLRAEMDRLQVAPDIAASVIEIVDRCEVARFSPALLEDQEPRHLLEQARSALGRI